MCLLHTYYSNSWVQNSIIQYKGKTHSKNFITNVGIYMSAHLGPSPAHPIFFHGLGRANQRAITSSSYIWFIGCAMPAAYCLSAVPNQIGSSLRCSKIGMGQPMGPGSHLHLPKWGFSMHIFVKWDLRKKWEKHRFEKCVPKKTLLDKCDFLCAQEQI